MAESVDQAPRVAFVNVETAARFLGISRGMAYQQARQHLDTGGGLRCIRIGHRLLVSYEIGDVVKDIDPRVLDEEPHSPGETSPPCAITSPTAISTRHTPSSKPRSTATYRNSSTLLVGSLHG